MCLVDRGPGVVPPILHPRSQDSSPAATTDETLPTMVQVVIGMPTVRLKTKQCSIPTGATAIVVDSFSLFFLLNERHSVLVLVRKLFAWST
jgi:hypothetical protein